VDGTAGPKDRASIETHLRQCGVCAREAGELRAWARSRQELPLGWLAVAAAVALFVLTPAVVRWTPMAGPRPGTREALAGLESLPESAQRGVRSALEAGFAEPPAALADLRPRPEVLMGEPAPGAFRLLEPLGTVVPTDRPTFRWQSLAGAESYTVTVYDESARRVLESPPLPEPVWTSGEPLERGRVLVWQVRARVGGRVVTAPVPPDPAARFKVLDKDEAQMLEQAARDHPTSHLLLGLLYAQAGVSALAEHHLRLVPPGDPNVEVAHRTLERLRP
jgi:hypothetical protein